MSGETILKHAKGALHNARSVTTARQTMPHRIEKNRLPHPTNLQAYPAAELLPEPLLTETRVAELLSVSARTLQMWRWRGGGPVFVRAGAAIRYRPADLRAWVEANLHRSTSDPGSAAN
jgi:hypothetical protein